MSEDIDIAGILEILPHRPPMLLVDRVDEVVAGERIRAHKNVTAAEPAFAGHFPGRPVMPGVLLLEAMAQAGAILVHTTEPFDPAVQPLMLLGIDRARFRRPVVPGDTLELTCHISARHGETWRLKASAAVDDQIVGRGDTARRRRCPARAMTEIHPTAVVDPTAEIDQGAQVGPFCVVGPEVRLGAEVVLHSHVVVSARATLGRRCQIFPFAVLGGAPQDRKYRDEPTELIIGDDVTVREHATIHRGTAAGGGRTSVGSGALLMAYTHVAHDGQIGREVIMTNGATLAGHVIVEDHAVLGGFCAVGQMLRVGESAMLAAGAMVEQDVPPYCIVAGDRARVRAVNVVGLHRRGLDGPPLSSIKAAFRLLFRSARPLPEAIELVREQVTETEQVAHLLEFIGQSRRGVCRAP